MQPQECSDKGLFSQLVGLLVERDQITVKDANRVASMSQLVELLQRNGLTPLHKVSSLSELVDLLQKNRYRLVDPNYNNPSLSPNHTDYHARETTPKEVLSLLNRKPQGHYVNFKKLGSERSTVNIHWPYLGMLTELGVEFIGTFKEGEKLDQKIGKYVKSLSYGWVWHLQDYPLKTDRPIIHEREGLFGIKNVNIDHVYFKQ